MRTNTTPDSARSRQRSKPSLPSTAQKRLSTHKVAELFCGCGGFSHGFAQTGRFQVVFGNDIKRHALRTFKLNHGPEADLPTILDKDLRNVTDAEIIKMLASSGVSAIDCLLGGPPCQGFSQMRRTKDRRGSKIVRFGGYNKLDQDPRNDLVLRFLEIAAALNPRVLVIENVPQFLRHYHNGKPGGIAEQVEEVLGELGYHVTCDVLNAADYGVPQLRQRAFIIASRLGRIEIPHRTHGEPDLTVNPNPNPWTTVWDALADLPQNPPHNDSLAGRIDAYASPPHGHLAKLLRTSSGFPHNHITRTYQRRIIQIIKNMRPGETWDDASARMQRRFESLITAAHENGESRQRTRKRLEASGKILPVFYKRYYWSAYTRLAWSSPALTITANSNFLGCGRFTHPDADRGITMREAARLQSFDDAFTFYTSDSPDHSTESIGVGLDMIGEAVPPLLANSLAKAIALHLDQKGT